MSVSTFLANVEAILQHGNATEHTYRPALKILLESLLTGYTAINEPQHAEYGAPDFVIHQHTTPIGHVEAKNIGIDLPSIIADSERDMTKTANGKQLKRYRAALPNLLYTDGLVWYWFVAGDVRTEVPVCIATWEKQTHKLHRNNTAETDLTALIEQFAQHVGGIVGTPKDLAHRLAQIARWLDEVMVDILTDTHTPSALHQQLAAFRQTLLPTITPTEFADMYAQTLVYGLFAARVAAPDNVSFTRYDAVHYIPRTNPFLQEMFYHIAGPKLDARIVWLVDDCVRLLAHTNMAEVLRDFGKATKQEDPVVHFYETFLTAYDPKTREMRGVYYTPEPVVSYIVRSVDHLLQTYFGKPMGLADGDTLILDPATGTATFLHTVVQHIYATLQDWGIADTWNQYVPEKLLPRVFGFELLMAPYTIAHLKLSMLLQQLGYTFGHEERLGIYLTNALIELPAGQATLPFLDFLVEEGNQARAIKQEKPVMVVLGNPPYSNYGMLNKGEWIQNQLQDYKKGLRERKLNLDDDFIKFMRFGQWRIEQTGEGILACITNNTYIDGITHRRMRESLMETFTDIYILNLHGNSRKKEVCPDGTPDENVFDIRQGVAIGIFVKEQGKSGTKTIHYAELWGKRGKKYQTLLDTDVASTLWEELLPARDDFFFYPSPIAPVDYTSLWVLNDCMKGISGIETKRNHFALDFHKEPLIERLKAFAYGNQSIDDLKQTYNLRDNEWDVSQARTQFSLEHNWQESITACLHRPFDKRWLIYHTLIISRQRGAIMAGLRQENCALIAARQTKEDFGVFVSDTVCTHKIVTVYDLSFAFPLYLYPTAQEVESGLYAAGERRPNFSAPFIAYVEHRLGLSFIPDGSGDLISTVGPEDVFHYIYAVLHSPTYRSRYAELLRIDFPRVPFTRDAALFKTLVGYGAVLVDLHLLRTPSQEQRVGGAGGASILAKPGEQGVTQHQATSATIGKITYDETLQRVVLDTDRYFAGIEPSVWAMQIGGYQPLQKWLKDRKGRTLSFDEVVHYMRMVVALHETQQLMQAIDAAIPGLPLE
jgi:predicted helicase